ncbi:hypothetical protein SLEP1_g6631 [Rubroshorea leprosula]|uniref:Uncharacterized protein n=1 Tax=Rubroshorea leprosula TaxID=152421 RepID=A0AAV5I4S1_9ROSI|nr:hypothetical protein SLEP1_g6631 [Rubroshorea leprosula]
MYEPAHLLILLLPESPSKPPAPAFEKTGKLPDLPCSFLPHRRLLLIVGDFWAFFRSP